jgi:hypothetical protein
MPSTSTDSNKGYEAIPSPSDAPSTLPKGTIALLGGLRIVAGAAIVLAPVTMCKLFAIPIAGSAIPVARLVGIRDLVLGELLFTADGGGDSRREVKRAFMAGAASDAVDVGIAATALAMGHFSRMGAGLFGGGAATFLLLGLYGLKRMY